MCAHSKTVGCRNSVTAALPLDPASGLVDEYLIYVAPKLIGPGRGLAELPELADLAQATALRFHDVQMVGEDLRVLARPTGGGAF